MRRRQGINKFQAETSMKDFNGKALHFRLLLIHISEEAKRSGFLTLPSYSL